ncbi:hypothetical protein ACFPRL_16115 [Pseudoclavibacter helvolus]
MEPCGGAGERRLDAIRRCKRDRRPRPHDHHLVSGGERARGEF